MRQCLCTIILTLVFMVACGDDHPTRPTSARAWSRSGIGNTVFDKPRSADRVRVTGAYDGNASNFIVYCESDLLINELLGTGFDETQYEGTHNMGHCGEVEITDSSGVRWSFTEQ